MRINDHDRLKLQQLRLFEWLEEREQQSDKHVVYKHASALGSVGDEWLLTKGIQLHKWQNEAIERWFESGRRGTMKVVTGAGKTILALGIIERLHKVDPHLRVAIVVPTIVLMQQWYEEILEHSNLPPAWIGRLGGGFREEFSKEKKVLISVLASARKLLPKFVKQAGIGSHLLLIVDECHRAGAPETSAVLETPRAYSLGLSATPEREDEEKTPDYNGSLLGRELGGFVYTMSIAQAVDLGILPPFQLEHYGLQLKPEEKYQYDRPSRSLSELRQELYERSPRARSAGSGDALLTWCRRVATKPNAELRELCARYVAEMTQRKRILYCAESRRTATIELLRQAFEEREEIRAIVFHESIEEVTKLFEALVEEGFPAVMEHSELPDRLREKSLDLFRRGISRIVVSARTLIEGFNVPAADLGIIAASSTSTRQRIQSIGRVLRKHRLSTGQEKSARICVLYISDSVDELIYEKENWNKLLGVDRNLYFKWDPPGDQIPQPGPPREYIPTEDEIDDSSLKIGDPFPGKYEGIEYSCDTQGNVLDEKGRIARNPQGIPERVIQVKGEAGKFKVTPKKKFVVVIVRSKDGWDTLYGGRLENPFNFSSENELSRKSTVVMTPKPGEEYKGPTDQVEEYRFSQKRGGMITKKVRRGEAFATEESASELIGNLRRISIEHRPVHKFFVNSLNHAFWVEGGKAFFIGTLNKPLEFSEELTT